MQSLRTLAFLVGVSLAAGAQSLLVVNQQSRDVSVIDPQTGHQLARVKEDVPGQWAHEVATSPDGRTAYLPVYGNSGVGKPGIDGHQLLVLDVPSRKIAATLDFGHGVRPHLPVFDATSGMLYVTTELDKSVTIVDPKSLKIVGAVPTGQDESHMLAISHDGRFGYTANVGPGTVSVLDLSAHKALAVIPVGKKVQRISISVDDKWVFTSDQETHELDVIDTAARTVKSRIPLPDAGYGSATTADGHWLLVAIPRKGQVAVIDLTSLQVARTIDVPKSPQAVLVRPDGKFAYVSCAESGKVAVIDLMQWKVQQTFTAGDYADGMAWAK